MNRTAHLILCILSTAVCTFAASPTEPPASQPGNNPTYPVPYKVPAPQQVADTLQRVAQCLNSRSPIPTTTDSAPVGLPPFSLVNYPMGVAYAGMLDAADATGDSSFNSFVSQRFQYLADQMAHPNRWPTRAQTPQTFRPLLYPGSLDDCGAMGAALIKAARKHVGPDMSPTIRLFADYILHHQYRLSDGTLARNRPYKDSVWADDMYMSVPFLSQMGGLTGDAAYYDEAAKQVLQIGGHLFVRTSGLFTHSWIASDPDDRPHYYWGRANGWCMLAIAELLDVMPPDHPRRSEVLKLFRAQAQGIASLQSGTGLWHQVLDRPDSYLETSCSAMFTYALARGVNHGWLDGNSYGPVALAGWAGLTTRITSDGRLQAVCIGTGYGDDYVFYYARPAGDDVHGYGPVLLAGSEIIRLVKNDRYKIEAGRGSAIYFLDKSRDVPTRPEQ